MRCVVSCGSTSFLRLVFFFGALRTASVNIAVPGVLMLRSVLLFLARRDLLVLRTVLVILAVSDFLVLGTALFFLARRDLLVLRTVLVILAVSDFLVLGTALFSSPVVTFWY